MADNKSKLTLVKLNKVDLAKGRHVLIVESPESRRAVALNVHVFSIGRHPHNDLVINDQLASRHHATVAWMKYSEGIDKTDYAYWIIDGKGKRQRSRNGMYINGNKKSLHRLVSGDVVKIGDSIKISYNYITCSTENSQFLNYCDYDKAPLKSLVQNPKSYKETLVIDHAFSHDDFADDSMMLENTIVTNVPEDSSTIDETVLRE